MNLPARVLTHLRWRMTNLCLLLLVYFICGAGEWWLSCARMSYWIRGAMTQVALLVFVESVVSLAVLCYFIKSNDFFLAIAYGLGGALGAAIVMKRDKTRAKSQLEPKASKTIKITQEDVIT